MTLYEYIIKCAEEYEAKGMVRTSKRFRDLANSLSVKEASKMGW